MIDMNIDLNDYPEKLIVFQYSNQKMDCPFEGTAGIKLL
jgi:hypothetical protein